MQFFLFDVRLRGLEQPPWRQFVLRATLTFQALHEAIQDACGWGDCHLFMFRGQEDLGAPGIAGSPFDDDKDEPDASRVKLRSYFKKPGDHLIYEYDFGDAWELDVTLKEIVEYKKRCKRDLVAGDLAFPPEDCGGLDGYLECVRVAEGGEDPDGLKKWLGSWTRTRFQLAAAQRRFMFGASSSLD